MTLQQEQERQKSLNNIIDILSKEILSSDEAVRMADELLKVYEGKFRHSYSEFFPLIVKYREDDISRTEYLSINLNNIREIIDLDYEKSKNSASGKSKYSSLYKSYRKLYDHIELDIARLSHYDKQNDKWDDMCVQIKSIEENIRAQMEQTKSTEEKIISQNNQTKNIDAELAKMENKIENSQKEYIAILGIFAAVVLTFTGGIAFSTSVLQNMHSSSIYRIIVVSLLIGVVLVNILFGLFYYISKIVKGTGKGNIVVMISINFLMFIMIGVTCTAWYFGFVEKRYDRVNASSNSVSSEKMK